MGTESQPLIDATSLLSLTQELRAVWMRVTDAQVTASTRSRWQQALAAIAEGATTDIDGAAAQLRRLAAQVDRTRR